MNRILSALVFIVVVAAFALTLLIGRSFGLSIITRWLLILLVFVAALALIGLEISGREQEINRMGAIDRRFVLGRVDGALIDFRNKMSLSRLQLALWMVVVISAWVTLGLHRTQGQSATPPSDDAVAKAIAGVERLTGVESPPTDGELPPLSPLNVALPQELLLAMGISVASLAGAGLIKANQATTDDGKASRILETRTDQVEGQAVRANQQAIASMAAAGAALEGLPATESLDAPLDQPPPAWTGRTITVQDVRQWKSELRRERAALVARPPAPATSTESLGETAPAPAAPSPAAAREAEARVDVALTRLDAAEKAAAEAERAREQEAKLRDVQANQVGELHARTSPREARWSDLFRGDTVANVGVTDLGKVQMFFWTVVLIAGYVAQLVSLMTMPGAAEALRIVPSLSLPTFSQSLVLILALSQGGYLAAKATA